MNYLFDIFLISISSVYTCSGQPVLCPSHPSSTTCANGSELWEKISRLKADNPEPDSSISKRTVSY